jgi:hypothetical protein
MALRLVWCGCLREHMGIASAPKPRLAMTSCGYAKAMEKLMDLIDIRPHMGYNQVRKQLNIETVGKSSDPSRAIGYRRGKHVGQ